MLRYATTIAAAATGGWLAALYLPWPVGMPLALVWGVLCGHLASIRGEDVRQAGYMRRWRLLDAWGRVVFVHRIDADDPDPHRHDHPFRGFSLILRGGYREVLSECMINVAGTYTLPAMYEIRRSVRTTLADMVLGRTYGYVPRYSALVPLQPRKYHRLTCVIPGTLTITFARRVPGGWGFLVRGKHVPSGEYLKAGRS